MTRFTLPTLGLVLLVSIAALAAPQQDPRAAEARLMTGARQLTFEGRRAGEGYYNADGTMMIFQSERDPANPFFQIYLLDLETGDVRKVSPGQGKTTCAWIHPSNERALYASTHEDPEAVAKQKTELDDRASGRERRYSWDYDHHFDIYEHDLKSGQWKNLSRVKGYDAEGSYSPDGTLIAFASNRHAYTEPISESDREIFERDKAYMMDIYIMNADGTDVRRLTTKRGYDGGPFFSPDGRKICWRRFNESGAQAEVFTINIDGTDERQLTRIGAMSWAPYFHPSGEYLIFATNRHGFSNFELYLVDKDGRGEPVRVTHTDGFDGLATFSPDGKTLAWTTNRTADKKSQIFVADWNHAEALRLVRSSLERASTRPTSRPHPVAAGPSTAGTKPAVLLDDLKRHTYRLASKEMNGRMTGTAGEKLATAYVAEWFERVGLEPAGDDGGWFQPFDVTMTVHDGAKKRYTGRNVLGVLRARSPSAKRGAVLVGAHVDHLGTEGGMFSRATGDAKDDVHLGADDNASGVATVIEMAEYLAAKQAAGTLKLERDVIFAAWSGEEIGLIGSRHYAEQLAAKAKNPENISDLVSVYVNLDMVGRLDKHLILSGIGSSSIWRGEIERRNAPVGVPLSLVDECHLPTDTAPFYAKGVPILAAFTGAHGDYHTPADTLDKLNYEGMEKIGRFLTLLTRGLATRTEPLDYIFHERKKQKAARSGSRPYLGTVPDYADAPIPGLALSDVSTGAPAHTAGVRGGDIIVELAGVTVENIYDYTEAIDQLEVGKAVKVVVVRDGKKMTFTIVPEARE